MNKLNKQLPPGFAVSLVFGLLALAFVLTFASPGLWQALAALAALLAASLLPLPRWPRVGALAFLILTTTIGLALKTGGDFLFIILAGGLIVLIKVKDVPLWFKASLSGVILLVNRRICQHLPV